MHIQDLLKLSGIVIIIVGLALRMRTTLVVAVAALATGLAAGLPLFSHEGFFQTLPYLTKPGQTGIINTLGRAFAENRLMTLFIITLPAIGLAEKYGLQEQAGALIGKMKKATTGSILIVYQLFRVAHGAMGIRLNGHAPFVRPLVAPMSIGAAQHVNAEENAGETIKAASAAAENYGNFYGQNLSVVQAGVLLVFGVMKGLGYQVSLWDLVKYTIPVVVASIVIGVIQFLMLDRRMKKDARC